MSSVFEKKKKTKNTKNNNRKKARTTKPGERAGKQEEREAGSWSCRIF